MATFTGTPRTWVAGETVTAALMNSDLRDPLAALSGAWNSWTPTLNQNTSTNISKTVNKAGYLQIGKLVIATCRLTSSGTGTSGSYVWVSLPVTPVSGIDGSVIGSGQYTDATADKYPAMILALTNGVRFMRADASQAAASGTGIGIDPVLTVASGDSCSFTVIYEAV